MKQLVISEEKAKELYKTASVEFKSVLEETFGKELFSEDIREKVKTCSDADIIYKNKHKSEREMSNFCLSKKHTTYINCLVDALVISEALNEGWEPDWNDTSQKKYTVSYSISTNTYSTCYYYYCKASPIYFKSEKLAEYFIEQFPEICKILYNGK